LSTEDPGPLTFVPTDELLDELGGRFDCMVFVALSAQTEDCDEMATYWRGDPMTCSGLCQYAQGLVFEDYNEKRKPSDG
jgi:hypothetical protein